jgi:hypothetical protein
VAALGERCCLVITEAAGCNLGEAVADLAAADDLRVCLLAAGTITDFDPQTELAPEAGPLFVYRPTGCGRATPLRGVSFWRPELPHMPPESHA